MDIYLKPLSDKKATFRFPSMPDGKIKVKTQSGYQSYDIIKKGTFKFPSGPGPATYQWDGYFWGKAKRRGALNRKWVSPQSCIKKLKKWEDRGTPLNLVISGGGVNADVTIGSFTYEPFGGGGDYSYSITFTQYRPLKIYTTDELGMGKKKKKKKKKSTRQPSKKKDKKQYMVVPGDTLWGIALKFYGKGSDWTKLYKANKDTVEKAAKAHGLAGSNNGWWIYAGTVLKIPS